jgi:hypothetical protein
MIQLCVINLQRPLLGKLIAEIERQFANSVDVTGDGISHVFFSKSARNKS